MPLVVFFNAKLDLVQEWFDGFGQDDLIVAADPDADLYEALGTVRKSYAEMAATSVIGMARAARAGLLPKKTSADMKRQGADVAVTADGEIAFLHLAQSPDDRIDPEKMLAYGTGK